MNINFGLARKVAFLGLLVQIVCLLVLKLGGIEDQHMVTTIGKAAGIVAFPAFFILVFMREDKA